MPSAGQMLPDSCLKGPTQLTSPQHCRRIAMAPHHHTCYHAFYILAILGCIMRTIQSYFTFLMSNTVEHFLMYMLAIWIKQVIIHKY